MRRQKKPRRPTEAQTRILRRIAQAGGAMILSRDGRKIDSYKNANGELVIVNNGERYHDQSGVTVPTPTAKRLIEAGWVVPQQDSMFDLTPQSWRVRAV